ncbi:MAG: hypothetical protein B7Z15_18215 [Rhizobiales bacterium 32-66-8]|nr:MAG: hypothetical protein B7Z15_18215 [Rhizobiales bacterium 32-66-8]
MTHKVERGETITEIAKKYQVTPYDIYKLNPDARCMTNICAMATASILNCG